MTLIGQDEICRYLRCDQVCLIAMRNMVPPLPVLRTEQHMATTIDAVDWWLLRRVMHSITE